MPALKSRLPLGSSLASLASLASRAHADAPHPLALLPARRERPPHRRAAEQCDEVAPSYVTCHAPLPWRHAQSNNITSLFDHFDLVARGARYLRLVFDIRSISRVVEEVRLCYRQT